MPRFTDTKKLFNYLTEGRGSNAKVRLIVTTYKPRLTSSRLHPVDSRADAGLAGMQRKAAPSQRYGITIGDRSADIQMRRTTT